MQISNFAKTIDPYSLDVVTIKSKDYRVYLYNGNVNSFDNVSITICYEIDGCSLKEPFYIITTDSDINAKTIIEYYSIRWTIEIHEDIYKYIQKADRIIDLGCGFGKTCLELYNKGYKNVVGVDINKEGIDFANGLGKFSCRLGDILHTKCIDDEFDCGIMQAVMTTLTKYEERVEVLKESNRIIKNVGYLYLSDFNQNWHLEQYRKRYVEGFEITKEEGSFPSYNKDNGEIEYIAHHYTEKRDSKLIN